MTSASLVTSKTLVMSSQADGYEREDCSEMVNWQQMHDHQHVLVMEHLKFSDDQS